MKLFIMILFLTSCAGVINRNYLYSPKFSKCVQEFKRFGATTGEAIEACDYILSSQSYVQSQAVDVRYAR